VLTVTAFWFVFRATGPGKAAPGAGERITHVAHVAMAAAMIAMMWLADPMGM
jgi:hypothetical protein